MAVDETQAQEGKPVRSKRPVYDVLMRRPSDLPTGHVELVLLEENVSFPSRGAAVDAARAKLPAGEQFGLFYAVRHGELVAVDRPDPHAALLDDLVMRLQEISPDMDPDAIRVQARLAVEQNGTP